MRQTGVQRFDGGAVLEPAEAARVLYALYLFAACSSAVVAFGAYVAQDSRVALLSGSCMAVFSALLLLARARLTAAAGMLGTSFLLGLVIVAMVTGNGIRDLSVPIFAFIMLMSNLVLDERHARLATAVTWLAAVGVALAEYAGVFRTPLSFRTDGESVVILASVHLALALTARRLVRAFHEGLQRAHVQELSYRHIFNATTEAILLMDPSTKRIIDVNQSAQSMFGYNRGELLRLTLVQMAGSHKSTTQLAALLECSEKGEQQLFEWTVTSKDGSARPVEVSLRPAVVGTRNVLLAVLRDASETRRLQAKLQESEKLQAVGQLAGGIAHDFNNQLTGILANATLLQSKLEDPKLQKCAEVIVRCSRRSSDLTSQLLAFARRGKHQDVTVDIHDLVAEVVDLLKHSVDKRILLETHLAAEELLVQGDPTLLQNALLNLGLNACDAMPQGGTLSFFTEYRVMERTSPSSENQLPDGDYVELTVRDTGEGMDEVTRKRAFEPFFTTKKTGNGMGLAAVYGTVESHRGRISLESQPGVGSTFSLLLPLSNQNKDSVTMKLNVLTKRFDGLCILLAEDEDDVAQTASAILEDHGCEVVRARDGEEAVEKFLNSPDKFDVVIVDHMMPRLSGREALQRMRASRPHLRALITSGYADETVVGMSSESDVFLPKPFSPAQLGSALVHALDNTKKA